MQGSFDAQTDRDESGAGHGPDTGVSAREPHRRAAGPDDEPAAIARHCRRCGSPVQHEVPPEDNRIRAVCRSCGTVHYDNPLNVVGTVCSCGPSGERVLLCRRAIAPRVGYWTLPAGFLELGETVAQGALRETSEEAGATVELMDLLALIDVLPAGQVHLLFRARMLDTHLKPGPETLDARLFEEHEVPWNELAFVTVTKALRHYFRCRRDGLFPLLVDRVA